MKTQIQIRIGTLALILALTLGLAPRAEAANKYWIATTAANWNSTANWSLSSGGAGGAAVPTAGDVAIFDGAGGANGDCSINATVSLTGAGGINIGSSYSGTISQGAYNITVGSTGWTQAGGTFNGGSNPIAINGPVAHSGGTFRSTSGTLTHNAATWTSNTGTPTFNANGGTVTFNRTHNNAVTVASGSIHFNNVYLMFSGGSGSIGVTGTMYVDGTLTLADRDVYSNGGITSGTIEVGGNLTMAASYWGLRATGLVKMTGTGSQTISTTGTSTFPPIEVAKSAGTLVLSGANSVSGWTWTSGALDASGSTLTVVVPYNTPITVTPGTVSYNNVGINVSGGSTTVTISGTWDVNGNYSPTIRDQYGSCKINTGTFNVAGNLTATYVSQSWGASTCAIVMDGTGSINATGGTVPCASLTVNTSGTVSLGGNLSLSGLTWTSGALDLSTNTLTLSGAATIAAGATTLGVTVAGSAPTNGLLTCSSTVSGIANAGLAMTITATPAQLLGQTYTILSNSGVLSTPFESVSWLGASGPWTGTVAYTANSGKNVTAANIAKVTGNPPIIDNLTPTNVTMGGASFNGKLKDIGSAPVTVSVRWANTEAGLTSGYSSYAWAEGAWGSNSFPTYSGASLTANTNYYYTFVGSNIFDTTLATPAQYLITGPLTVLTGDGICGVSATDTATIAISRPGTYVSGPLTVNYVLSGAGAGYVSASPASGFTLAAGQTSTNIVLTPVQPNLGAPVGVTLTLLPGTYPSDALGSDSISVATMVASDVTLTGDVYIDAADGGKLKYVSGGAVAAYSWAGTTLDGETYAYTFQFQNLNLGGYNVHGAINHSQSQASALFQASGNVSGGGSFQFHTASGNFSAGNLRLEAAGSIALSNVWTYVTPGTAASTYLWAKGGPVTLTGSINNEGRSTRVAPVVVRSEGPAGSRGIAVAGGNSGYSIRTHSGGSSSGGKPVWLCSEGDITLGSDLVATGSGGDVTIRGNYTNAALRAGNVVVRGSIPTWFITGVNSGYGSGNIAVLATNLVVDGSFLTYCASIYQRGGGIRVDVTGDTRIGGYLDTHGEWDGYGRSSPGPVFILARRTAINGTNTTGHSILTKPTATSGSFWVSQAGDGNITLTNVDTATSWYDPANPLQGDTSSLSISGKVEAAYCSADIKGDIFLSAVEVQLHGDVINSSSISSSIMSIHYGTNKYGVVTHLMENGVRWNGVASHNILYTLSPGTLSFVGDVPYAGALVTAVAGTIENGSVTNVTPTSATFRGHLQTAGDPTSAVSVVWGQTAGNLDSTNSWSAGTWGDNSYPSTNISPLTANTNYYYTFVAENTAGRVLAANTQYLITGPLTVLTGDGLCGVSATDTASIAISRPGTCVSGPLTVNYALSGAGTGYVSASPASGVTLAAGQATTNIVLTPVQPNLGAPAGVTLTLLPGAYPSDALGSDAISVGTVVAPDATLTGDVYIDAADGGKMKYVTGGAVVAVPWAGGTTLDGETYAYTFQFQNLNLGGYNVHGAINHNQSQSRALFQVGGNVSGGGSFYFYTTVGNLTAGNLRVEAAGSIALSNVWCYVTPNNGTAASTYLWAKGGPVTLTGSINNEGASTRVAPVVVRSDGPAGSRGIAVAGGNSGYSIRTHSGGSSSGGKPVWLCTEGDITLGGDVVATASGGGVTIRGNYTNAALRAGNVVVHGSIPTWFITYVNSGYGSGNIAVLATNLVVDGSFLTYCASVGQRGGGIRVDVTGDARFGGYLDTHTEWDGYNVSSPGSVYILARHTAINGTNTTGHSVLTKPSQTSGTFAASQPGDGNITLTNVDTSTSLYDSENPLQGDTSSLCVSGKVEAAYCGLANIQGDIYLSAVEVQLAGEIATSAGPNSDIAVHYGVTTYGIVTHLVENGTRWNGADGHSVTYGQATPVFVADVPYLGMVFHGTVFRMR